MAADVPCPVGVKVAGTDTAALGLYYPFFLVSRQAFLVSHSYFGGERFDFTGRGRDLFGRFLLALLLTVPTLGLCWVWYVAFKRRYFWDHTTFGAAHFSCSVTGGALLGLWVVNALILVGTLGIAWPWVRVRNVHFAFRNLALVGALDLSRIRQEAQQVGSMGEGLSGFFDSGFDLERGRFARVQHAHGRDGQPGHAAQPEGYFLPRGDA